MAAIERAGAYSWLIGCFLIVTIHSFCASCGHLPVVHGTAVASTKSVPAPLPNSSRTRDDSITPSSLRKLLSSRYSLILLTPVVTELCGWTRVSKLISAAIRTSLEYLQPGALKHIPVLLLPAFFAIILGSVALSFLGQRTRAGQPRTAVHPWYVSSLKLIHALASLKVIRRAHLTAEDLWDLGLDTKHEFISKLAGKSLIRSSFGHPNPSKADDGGSGDTEPSARVTEKAALDEARSAAMNSIDSKLTDNELAESLVQFLATDIVLDCQRKRAILELEDQLSHAFAVTGYRKYQRSSTVVEALQTVLFVKSVLANALKLIESGPLTFADECTNQVHPNVWLRNALANGLQGSANFDAAVVEDIAQMMRKIGCGGRRMEGSHLAAQLQAECAKKYNSVEVLDSAMQWVKLKTSFKIVTIKAGINGVVGKGLRGDYDAISRLADQYFRERRFKRREQVDTLFYLNQLERFDLFLRAAGTPLAIKDLRSVALIRRALLEHGFNPDFRARLMFSFYLFPLFDKIAWDKIVSELATLSAHASQLRLVDPSLPGLVREMSNSLVRSQYENTMRLCERGAKLLGYVIE